MQKIIGIVIIMECMKMKHSPADIEDKERLPLTRGGIYEGGSFRTPLHKCHPAPMLISPNDWAGGSISNILNIFNILNILKISNILIRRDEHWDEVAFMKGGPEGPPFHKCHLVSMVISPYLQYPQITPRVTGPGTSCGFWGFPGF